MLIQPVRHGPHRDLRRSLIRKMKNSRGNAAESDAADFILKTHIKRVPVAVREIPFQVFREPPGYDRTYDMDHLLRGKVVPVCQHRHRRRLLIVPAIFDSQLIHLPAALRAKLDPGIGVDTVIDTGVHGDKAAQHPGIGRIHDGIGREPCDIPLPDRDAVRLRMPASQSGDRRDVFDLHDPVFPVPLPQVFILHREDGRVHHPRHADVHEGPEDPPLIIRIRRGFEIPVLYGIFFELFYQVIKPFILVHSPFPSSLHALSSDTVLIVLPQFCRSRNLHPEQPVLPVYFQNQILSR